MLPLRLFRNGAFTGAQVAAFAISSSFFAIFLYMTLYLQQILGLSAIEAGLVYLPGTIVMFFVSGATAALGEKVSAKAMIGSGLFNPALSAVALGSVPTDQSGLAAGVNDTFRQAGIAVGVAALGALVPAADAFGGDAANYVDGLHTALYASAALCIV